MQRLERTTKGRFQLLGRQQIGVDRQLFFCSPLSSLPQGLFPLYLDEVPFPPLPFPLPLPLPSPLRRLGLVLFPSPPELRS